MQLPIELSHPCYHDEGAARVQLELIRWPNGPFCPICGSFDRVKPYGGKAMGPGWYWCTPCRRKFTVRVGSSSSAMISRLTNGFSVPPHGGIEEGLLGAPDAPDPQG